MASLLNPDDTARPAPAVDPDGPDGPVPPGMKRTRKGLIKRRSILWRARKAILMVVALVVLAGSGGGYAVWAGVELPAEQRQPESSFLCAADVTSGCNRDTAFAEFAAEQAGVHVAYAEIPEVFIDALVAAEDKDYFVHEGVDPTGIARAVWHEVRTEGKGQQGGSTITQQYIKTVSKDDEGSLKRKVTEAIRAVKLERERSKEQILEGYLNTIYFGRNAYGLDAAVRAYFGDDKRVKDLDLKMSAYLAAVIREPEFVDAQRSATDPLRDKQQRYATERRRQVLDQMVGTGAIVKAQRDEVVAMGWDYVVPKRATEKGALTDHAAIGGVYWQNYVKDWLLAHTDIEANDLYGDGLRIYSSFDPVRQAMAYEAINAVLTEYTPPEIGTALTSIDDQGFLRVMVGGRDPSNHFNSAYSKNRSTGSAFKPIVLAEYLAQGKSLDAKVPNPLTRNWEGLPVVNSHAGEAQLDVIRATVESSNTSFSHIMDQTGVEATLALADKLSLDPDRLAHEKRLVLGQHEGASPIDMATAYSIFANGGERVGGAQAAPYPVTKVTDAKGSIVWEAPLTRTRVLAPEVAAQMNFVLKGVVEDPKGTGNKMARVEGQTVAGKTGSVLAVGTHEKPVRAGDNTDAWFVGYTCRQTAAVWFGRKDGNQPLGTIVAKPLTPGGRPESVFPVDGGTLPARIFSEYMRRATQGQISCPFDRPLLPGQTTTTWSTGTLAPTTIDRATTTTVEATTTTTGSGTTTTSVVPTTTTRRGNRPTTTTTDDTTPTTGVTVDTPAGRGQGNAAIGALETN